MKNNPYKANQYKPDPRQSLFLQSYLNPKSETFGNAYQSAIKAKYSKEYAEVITGQMPTWLSENLGDANMLNRAEKNLKDFLENASEKVKADITKFVAERLGKKKWSARTELTGKDGVDLFKLNKEEQDKINQLLK